MVIKYYDDNVLILVLLLIVLVRILVLEAEIPRNPNTLMEAD